MSAQDGLRTFQQVLREVIAVPHRTERCPPIKRWLEVTAGASAWAPEEESHIADCPTCRRYQARSFAALQPESSFVVLGNQIRRTWRHLAVPTFVIVPCILLLIVVLIQGRSVGLTHWAANVQSATMKSGVLGFFGTALAALVMRHYGLLDQIRLCLFAAGFSLLGGVVATNAVVGIYADDQLIKREELFQNHRWILYDSVFFWPDGPEVEALTGRPGQRPNEAQIRHELETLRAAGFDGLYLYDNPRLDLLRIAAELQFVVVQGVGVTHPDDFSRGSTRQQIEDVIAARDYVDAIVLGHMRARDVNMTHLQDHLAHLRRETGKPVTPNFLQSDLRGVRGNRLARLSDFLVSDLPRPYDPSAGDPQVAIRKVEEGVAEFSHFDVPALLVFCGYPSAGGAGFSQQTQETYVRGVLSIDLPRGVNLVFATSFDLPWKEKLSEVSGATPLSDSKLGFFETELIDEGASARFTPKPALETFQDLGAARLGSR